MDSLADRLKALGFKNASTLPAQKQASLPKLEEVIGGSIVENSTGSFVLKSSFYPFGYLHGRTQFVKEIATEAIQRVGKVSTAADSLEKLLFLDTETSGLSGGAGTFAFLVGMGRFVDDGFLLEQFIIHDPAEETAMLLHISNLVHPDTVFVSFNGKSFDIPILQNRMVISRLPVHLRENSHLDVLHVSRKLWRKQLPSCTLKDLESAILQFVRSSEDVPGWMVPDIYFDYLRSGDPRPLADVVYHNAVDVVSLAALFIHITGLLRENAGNEDVGTEDLLAICRIYWDLGSFEPVEKMLVSLTGRRLGQAQKIAIYSMLGQYRKLLHAEREGAQFWQIAADQGDISSCIELAKYFEHQEKDIPVALGWAKKAVEILSHEKREGNYNTMVKDLEKRIARLELKGSRHV